MRQQWQQQRCVFSAGLATYVCSWQPGTKMYKLPLTTKILALVFFLSKTDVSFITALKKWRPSGGKGVLHLLLRYGHTTLHPGPIPSDFRCGCGHGACCSCLVRKR